MELTPRYGTNPIITLDGSPPLILQPVTRQRRRLADALASFTDDQWAHPSRCAGWSNRDVIVHLDSTNSFWAFSIASGLRGTPTTFLSGFDPVASPAQLVAGSNELTAQAVLEKFAASAAALDAVFNALSDSDWLVLAEAPPGHISINALAHHALWDSWIHERDVLLPLGIAPAEEPDEVTACLRYVAALAPGFAVSRGRVDNGTLAVQATTPDAAFVVEVGDHVHVRTGSAKADLLLNGPAVDLVEALSIRAPLKQSIPTDLKWMVNGLAEVFDVG
ncbi:MAG: maleylpyruvate isomerase family mycothiol-dependent enzyme [Ilumatobacteraceae bacterium]